MRIYSTGSSGIWFGVIFLAVMVMIFVALGGFLLGTPLGLALLTFFIIRSVYRSYKRKQMRTAYEQARGPSWESPFGFGETYNQSTESADRSEAFEEETVVNRNANDFASRYKDVDGEHKVFTSDDLRNAVDVEFKEI